MKYPTKLSDAAHILAFIALHPECDLTSGKLAESVQTNPAYVRQLMSAMRKGGLLLSVKGHPKPALAREPARISLLDIYRAVEGDKPLLHQDTHTNPACGVGGEHPVGAAELLHGHPASGGKPHAPDHPAGYTGPIPCQSEREQQIKMGVSYPDGYLRPVLFKRGKDARHFTPRCRVRHFPTSDRR